MPFSMNKTNYTPSNTTLYGPGEPRYIPCTKGLMSRPRQVHLEKRLDTFSLRLQSKTLVLVIICFTPSFFT